MPELTTLRDAQNPARQDGDIALIVRDGQMRRFDYSPTTGLNNFQEVVKTNSVFDGTSRYAPLTRPYIFSLTKRGDLIFHFFPHFTSQIHTRTAYLIIDGDGGGDGLICGYKRLTLTVEIRAQETVFNSEESRHENSTRLLTARTGYDTLNHADLIGASIWAYHQDGLGSSWVVATDFFNSQLHITNHPLNNRFALAPNTRYIRVGYIQSVVNAALSQYKILVDLDAANTFVEPR